VQPVARHEASAHLCGAFSIGLLLKLLQFVAISSATNMVLLIINVLARVLLQIVAVCCETFLVAAA